MSELHQTRATPDNLETLHVPQPRRTAIAERCGSQTQSLLDLIFHSPEEELHRAVLIDYLEGRNDNDPFLTYLRLALHNPNSTEAEALLHAHRCEFDSLWVPNVSASDRAPSLVYENGLPRKILCTGDLIYDSWYAAITLPLERVILSYGHEIDTAMLEPLRREADYAIANHDGTGLLPVHALHYGLAPMLDRFAPTADVSDIRRGVTTALGFFRALRMRGLVRNECSPSTLGHAMRNCVAPLTHLEVHTLSNELLFIIDGCHGRGATRYAVEEGFIPLLRALDTRPQTPLLRPFTLALLTYVNELIRIGVPIGTIMRRDLQPILVSLQADPTPAYFNEMLQGVLRNTRR